MRLPLVLGELGAALACVGALALTHSIGRASTTEGAVVELSYVLAGVSIAVASAAFDAAFSTKVSTSCMLLFYALLGNVAGLRFLRVLHVCVATLAIYVLRLAAAKAALGAPALSLWHSLLQRDAASSGAAGSAGPRPILPPGEPLDGYEWLFWLCAAVVGSLSSGYWNESYERRRYVLVERLKDETRKTDAFLYRMLPLTVVAQMKQGFHVADEFEDVFILASDIVGFTKLSANAKPSEVMKLLSDLFSKFDHLSETAGVYKVLTIGDAYIACTGIFNGANGDPQDEEEDDLTSTSEGRARRRKQNARAIVAFAMGMIDTLTTIQAPEGTTEPLNMRIGIHMGHLTAGVIGTKRLRYDVWGPAYLAATALESNGIPGAVCVSEQVLRHLDGAGYDWEMHTRIPLKAALKDGTTEVDSFQLKRKANRASATAGPPQLPTAAPARRHAGGAGGAWSGEAPLKIKRSISAPNNAAPDAVAAAAAAEAVQDGGGGGGGLDPFSTAVDHTQDESCKASQQAATDRATGPAAAPSDAEYAVRARAALAEMDWEEASTGGGP